MLNRKIIILIIGILILAQMFIGRIIYIPFQYIVGSLALLVSILIGVSLLPVNHRKNANDSKDSLPSKIITNCNSFRYIPHNPTENQTYSEEHKEWFFHKIPSFLSRIISPKNNENNQKQGEPY
jgi:hypothetical protein